MNNSKQTARSILLSAAFLLAMAILISVMALFTAASETPREVGADAVSVSLDGKVNLNFKFIELEDGAESFKAMIGEEVIGHAQKTDDQGRTVVTVSLRPYQMTEDVMLYQLDESNNELAVTICSVLDYAKKVLAREDLKDEWHDAIRAMLNYGAMTQIHASINIESLANEGLFPKNNPKDSVTSVPAVGTESSAELGGVFTEDSSVKLVLNSGDIALKYTVVYNDDVSNDASADDLVASVSDGKDVNESGIKLKDEGNGIYSFTISNLGVGKFNAVWTVSITDGAETITSSHSVLEYLKWNVETANEEDGVKDEEKDVCRALYRLYLFTSAKPDQQNCKHANAGYRVSADADTSYYKCTACGKQMEEKAIPDEVDVYIPGSVFATLPANSPNDETKLKIIEDENGNFLATWYADSVKMEIYPLREKFKSSNLSATLPTGGGDGSWNIANNGGVKESYDDKESYSFDIGGSKYVIIRCAVKTSTENGNIKLSLGSTAVTYKNQSSANQGGVYSAITLPCTSDGEMATYVVPLELFGEKVGADTNGNRTIDGLKIVSQKLSAGDTLIIDYIAFVDEKTDVDYITVEGETVIYKE